MDQDRASRLLGVEGVRVVEVDREDDGRVTVWLITSDPAAAVCPDCATRAGRVHQWVLTRPRDLPRGRDRVDLVWLKRRWKCENPGCERVTFTEVVDQVPAGARVSGRLRAHAADLVGELGVAVSAAAGVCGLSWPTAHQGFIDHVDPVLGAPRGPVRVLGIDETRRGRVRLARDPGTGDRVLVADRWHTGFVDISGDQGLLGQVEGRTADDAAYWLHQAGPAWRERVRIVVIDMCTIYASAIRRMLPHATLAVDVFHVVQLATKMVGDVRRRAIREKYGRRGRSGDSEYGIKNLLVKNLEHLHPDQFAKIIDTLGKDAEGQQILLAWIAKEKLRDLIRLRATITGTTPSPEQIRHH
ncbi:MAG: ISL3 family transposase, partial [Pseudonocardiaceae bacterium]